MQTHALSYDAEAKKWSARFPAGDSPRTLVTAFGASELADQPELLVEVARAYPRSLVIGCSTAGEIHGNAVRDRSLAVTVTHFDRTDLQLASVAVESIADSEAAGVRLGRKLSDKPGLRAAFVLGDGTAVNGAALARGLSSAVESTVIVTGGLAADGKGGLKPWLTIGGAIKHKIACAVGFYGPNLVVGHGISSDWIEQPSEWIITRADGNRIYEFDNRPALEAYRSGLSDRADELPDVAVWYPLLIRIADLPPLVRTVTGIDPETGALILAGDVQVGQRATLLNADVGDLIDGGGRAASMATKTGGPVSVDCLALTVSCVGRRKILGEWCAEEVQSMREGLLAQRAAVTGFYAQAQISPDVSGAANLHNQTLTLTVFSEARPTDSAQRAPRTPWRSIPSGYAVRTARYDSRAASWASPLPELDSPRTLVLAFGAPELAEDRGAIDTVRSHYANSIVVGCSTAGEIFGSELYDNSLVVSAARFTKTDLRLAVEKLASGDESAEVGKRIGAAMMAERKLRGILVLADGLVVRGSELVRGINAVVGGSVPVVGGFAADGTAFERTWVLAGDLLDSHTVAAVGFYGNYVVMGQGARSGWDRFGVKRTITRSAGNTLYELDGRPALQIYKEYLGERAVLPAAGLSLPLAVREPSTDAHAIRTMLAIDEQAGSVTFSGDVPTGAITQFMQADFGRLVNGATHAALSASESNLPGSPECLAIAISSAGRRQVLGAYTEGEIEAVTTNLRSERVRVTGFYGYGELSSTADGLCDLHNQAMTVAVLSESVTPIARSTVPPKLPSAPDIAPPSPAAPREAPQPSPMSRSPRVTPGHRIVQDQPTAANHSAADPNIHRKPKLTREPNARREPKPTLEPKPTVEPKPSLEPKPTLEHTPALEPSITHDPRTPIDSHASVEKTTTLQSGDFLSGSFQHDRRGAIVRIPRPPLTDIAIEETGAGDPRIIRIGGRITEAFKGDVAAKLLRNRVILDLGDVQRITSFGVREWLAMFSGAFDLQESYMARCSESVVTQLTLIRKFDGGSQILSFFAPYLCDSCNKPFERLFDRDLDADEIRNAAPESVKCPRCDGPGRFDDDPRSYFAFFAAHERTAIPPEVRKLHNALCAQDQVRPAEDLEKVIEGDTTRVRVNGKLTLGIRWRRVFDHIEGPILVDLSSVTSAEVNGIQSMDIALRTVAEHNPVAIEFAPVELLERFVNRPAPKIEIVSVVVAGLCRSCEVTRTTPVQLDRLLTERHRDPEARCRRCDSRLELQIDPVVRAYVANMTARASVPTMIDVQDERSGPQTQRWTTVADPSDAPRRTLRKYLPAAGILSVAAVAAALGPSLLQRPATTTIVERPTDTPTWNRQDDLPPPWVDQPFVIDNDSVYLVGEGEASTITEAIAKARVDATELLIRQLLEGLGKSQIHELVTLRMSKTAASNSAAIRKFSAQYGNLARLERTEVASRTLPAGVHAAVRYKLAKASFDQVLSAYRETATLHGITVAEQFPLLAESIPSQGNVVIVAIDETSPATSGDIRIGDLVVAVDATEIATPKQWLAAGASGDRDEIVLKLERSGTPHQSAIKVRNKMRSQ
jgi:hypothetical protein